MKVSLTYVSQTLVPSAPPVLAARPAVALAGRDLRLSYDRRTVVDGAAIAEPPRIQF